MSLYKSQLNEKEKKNNNEKIITKTRMKKRIKI